MTLRHSFALLLLKSLGRLPFPLRRFSGRALGELARLVLGYRSFVVARNLQAAFPDLSGEKRNQLLRAHFRHLGETVMDDLWGLTASAADLRRRVVMENEQLFPATGAVIAFVPHCLGFNIAGLRLSLRRKGMFFYKPMHSRFWDIVLSCLRGRFGNVGTSAVQPYSLRHCVQHLKSGGMLYYLPDIDPGRRKSMVFARFLGVESTATSVVLGRLVKMTGAPVVPCLISITANGYKMKILPPWEEIKNDDEAMAERINRVVEEHVRCQPAQYYWLQRRFKTRPENEGDFYRQ